MVVVRAVVEIKRAFSTPVVVVGKLLILWDGLGFSPSEWGKGLHHRGAGRTGGRAFGAIPFLAWFVLLFFWLRLWGTAERTSFD